VFILYCLEHLLRVGINDLGHGLQAFGNRVHGCGIINGLDITYGLDLHLALQPIDGIILQVCHGLLGDLSQPGGYLLGVPMGFAKLGHVSLPLSWSHGLLGGLCPLVHLFYDGPAVKEPIYLGLRHP
jgi:hypothetical protein